MLPSHFGFPSSPRTPRQIRRFRATVALLLLFVGVLPAMQYGARQFLPPAMTDTLRGVAAGMLVMGVVLDRRLAQLSRRGDRE